jgi:hypothetical protein
MVERDVIKICKLSFSGVQKTRYIMRETIGMPIILASPSLTLKGLDSIATGLIISATSDIGLNSY